MGDVPAGLPHGRDAAIPGAFLPVWEEDPRSLKDGDGGLRNVMYRWVEGLRIPDLGDWPFKIPSIVINLN